MKKVLTICLLFSTVGVFAQNTIRPDSPIYDDYSGTLRPITTAVPIIAISPDSRAGGMGDVGVASSPDANSLFWNPAKLSFLEDGSKSLSISYTPWLNKLVNDINLGYLSFVSKIGDNQGFGVAMRYFSLGEINFKDENNNPIGTGQPYEMTLEGAYSLKLSEEMSLAVGLRWIYSDLLNGQITSGINTDPGTSFAADIGYYYQSREMNIQNGMKQSFSAGLNISNIGAKISYGNEAQSDFIPTNLRLGGGYHLKFDQYNRMSFYLDFNKLMVPTPPIREGDTQPPPGFTGDQNGNGIDNDGEVLFGKDDDVNAFKGMFQSFSDAPGGFSEEMEEILINIGAEYWYNNRFAVRGGYQYEDQQKGGRQYFTMGLGIRYNVFGLDFAYLIPASATVRSPLENTLRFTLIFDFQDFSDQES